ncbi:MAG: HD domain-containing protein [Geminicoccaceae bacterium]
MSLALPAILVATADPERLLPALGAHAGSPRLLWLTRGTDLLVAAAVRGESVAVIDLDLPDIPGLTLARRLRGGRRRGPPHLVLVGREADGRLASRSAQAVADALVALPDDHRLAAELDRLAGRSGLGPEPAGVAVARAIGSGRRALLRAARAVGDRTALPLGDVAPAAAEIAGLAADGSLRPLLDVLRTHHDATYAHSLRVAAGMTLFGSAVGLRADDLQLLALAGLLHDIGKTAVPNALLDKPARLDEREWGIMRQHPLVAEATLRRSGDIPDAVVAAAARHHERLDGSGYPRALTGLALDDVSLLCGVVDVHVALTEPRAYKPPLEDEAAFALMRDGRPGTALEASFVERYRQIVLDGRRTG